MDRSAPFIISKADIKQRESTVIIQGVSVTAASSSTFEVGQKQIT